MLRAFEVGALACFAPCNIDVDELLTILQDAKKITDNTITRYALLGVGQAEIKFPLYDERFMPYFVLYLKALGFRVISDWRKKDHHSVNIDFGF